MLSSRLARRKWQLIIILVATATIFLLASGLSSLALTVEAPTGSLPTIAVPEEAPPPEVEEETAPRDPIDIRTVVALVVVYFLLLVATYVLFPETRRPLITTGIILGMVFGYWYFFIYRQPTPEVNTVRESFTDEEVAAAIESQPVAPAYIRDASDEVDLAFSLVIVAAAAGLGLFLWYRLRREETPEETTLDKLADSWEEALSDLHAGKPLRDTVLRCYLEMSSALRRTQGVERAAGMTAREFERFLVTRGFPEQAVQRLTRLFEQVRYGGAESTERERREAIASMEAIVAAARSRQRQGLAATPQSVRRRSDYERLIS